MQLLAVKAVSFKALSEVQATYTFLFFTTPLSFALLAANRRNISFHTTNFRRPITLHKFPWRALHTKHACLSGCSRLVFTLW